MIYTSEDGGLTFGPATVVGTTSVGSARAIFDGADRRIATVTVLPVDGVLFQAAPLGQWTQARARLTPGYNDTISASLVQRERNSFAVAWHNLDNVVRVRTFTCSLDPCPLERANNVANWSPAVEIAAAGEPILTTGPAGTFLLYHSTATPSDRRWLVRKLDGTTPGPPLLVGEGLRIQRDLVEDAGGILHAVYTGSSHELVYRASADGGVSWGAEQTIVPGNGATVDALRIAARSTDAGFVGSAFWQGPSTTRNGPIMMAALPAPSVSLPLPRRRLRPAAGPRRRPRPCRSRPRPAGC